MKALTLALILALASAGCASRVDKAEQAKLLGQLEQQNQRMERQVDAFIDNEMAQNPNVYGAFLACTQKCNQRYHLAKHQACRSTECEGCFHDCEEKD